MSHSMWAKAYHLTFLCDFRKTDPMGSHLGGVAHVSSLIEADRSSRDTGLYKPHISGLSDLAASVPSYHGVNTSELASVLPREVRSDEERYRYIGRPLSDPRIDPFSVMGGQVPEVVDKLSSNGQTVVLMMGQSKISQGFECLMVSLRMGDRAIPVAWWAVQTKGPSASMSKSPCWRLSCPCRPLVRTCCSRQTASMAPPPRSPGVRGENLTFQHQGPEITGAFTNDMALLKLVYLATMNIQKKWTSPLANWSLTVQQLYIKFGDRIPLLDLTH